MKYVVAWCDHICYGICEVSSTKQNANLVKSVINILSLTPETAYVDIYDEAMESLKELPPHELGHFAPTIEMLESAEVDKVLNQIINALSRKDNHIIDISVN